MTPTYFFTVFSVIQSVFHGLVHAYYVCGADVLLENICEEALFESSLTNGSFWVEGYGRVTSHRQTNETAFVSYNAHGGNGTYSKHVINSCNHQPSACVVGVGVVPYDIEGNVQNTSLHIRAVGVLGNAVERIISSASALGTAAGTLGAFVKSWSTKSECGGGCFDEGNTEYCVSICTSGSYCDTTATEDAMDIAFANAINDAYQKKFKNGYFILNSGGTWHACVTWRQMDEVTYRPSCPGNWCS